MTEPCPCDTGKPYPACCGRLHAGRPAPTAVALMRSRYSAFTKHLASYLLHTWHPATRPPELRLDDAMRCRLFGKPERPPFCGSLQPGADMCGASRGEAFALLDALEAATRP